MATVERLKRLTPEQVRRRRTATIEVLWVCTLALIPWTIYLGLSLPADYNARHWAAAWTGFDVLELLALAATAYFGWKRRQALIGTAIAAATLLICDAWFDITLDLGTPDIWWSLGSAAFIELPLAFFLLHRATLLMRLTMLRYYPEAEGDGDGRPLSLWKIPLIAALPYDEEVEAAVEVEQDAREVQDAQDARDVHSDEAGNSGSVDAR
jgi:hypothetical protein